MHDFLNRQEISPLGFYVRLSFGHTDEKFYVTDHYIYTAKRLDHIKAFAFDIAEFPSYMEESVKEQLCSNPWFSEYELVDAQTGCVFFSETF